MDENVASTLRNAIQKELTKRFDLDDSAMAEYIIVMLQNGKDVTGLTEELSDLIGTSDASLSTWIFQQMDKLKSGQPIDENGVHSGEQHPSDQDVAMDVESQVDTTKDAEQGMGYPSARLYSGIRKTLESDGTDQSRTRHRPDTEGVRSTPYGTVATGNGTTHVPDGPRADNGGNRSSNSGPIRSKRGRGDRSKGPGRQQAGFGSGFPEMPQFPGFPMPPAELFAGMLGPLPANAFRTPSRRCTRWPTCLQGKACTFGHPTSMCQNPNCRKTEGNCTSIHADEDVDLQSGMDVQRRTEEEQEAKVLARAQQKQAQQFRSQNNYHRPASSTTSETTTPICKFGEACTNRACQYAHPSPVSKNGSSIVLNSEFCAKGIECKDENCSFSHPSPSNMYTPGVKLNNAAADISCKFNPCLNPACRFQHAPGQKTQATFGSARNKVWTPNAPAVKSTAERSFVTEEVEEQFNAMSNVHDNDTEMEK